MEKDYKIALDLFQKKDYISAFNLFDKLNLPYECGYCKLMCANLFEAENIWENSKIDSPAINWGLSLIKLINLTIPQNLTFFQIRNFLERDLKLLIENHHLKYVENIISAESILTEYNPETSKFIGRALLHSGFYEQAFEFLIKSRNICYVDPEIHFLLAQYYITKNQPKEAENVLRISLELNPEYFPAEKLIQQLTSSTMKLT